MGNYSLKVCVRLLAGSVAGVACMTFLWHTLGLYDVFSWPRPGMSITGSLCFFLTSLALLILVHRMPMDVVHEVETIRQVTDKAICELKSAAALSESATNVGATTHHDTSVVVNVLKKEQ